MAGPQDNAPPPESLMLQAYKGLKNTVNAERLGPDEFQRAVNVDLDNAGQPRLRRGYTLKIDANVHSVFSAILGTLAVINGQLSLIYPDYSTESLQPGANPPAYGDGGFVIGIFIGSEPLAYVDLGDKVYYSSRTRAGVIDMTTKTVNAWGADAAERTWLSPVVNPTSTLSPIGGKLLAPPPLATDLAYLNGRIYLAHEKTLWATELYLYDYVDATKNFLPFESKITFVGAVTDGLYVGTTSAVWFLSGPLGQMKRVPLMAVPGIPGSLVALPEDLIRPELPPSDASKNAVMFMTGAGLCAGFDNGVCYNLTQTQVLFPEAVSVASMFRQQDGINQYVAVADSGGTPSANTRIGDYVDAEIRRFQGA